MVPETEVKMLHFWTFPWCIAAGFAWLSAAVGNRKESGDKVMHSGTCEQNHKAVCRTESTRRRNEPEAAATDFTERSLNYETS